MQKRPSTLIRSYCVLRCEERNCDWAISQVPSFATRINCRVETSGETCIIIKPKKNKRVQEKIYDIRANRTSRESFFFKLFMKLICIFLTKIYF